MKPLRCSSFAIGICLLPLSATLSAESTLSPALRDRVDATAREVLAITGVPSASIAVVTEGQIAYLQAYGDAAVEPHRPARPEMRYSIGSISKQFTAAAILMLAEEHKLSLDDTIARFVPTVTRAGEVTIRQLLAHTSGYQDYWPQDYVPPFMLREVSAETILDLWARRPLDFEPGTQWQYSNTNYVIAGLIVEKVSGRPLLQFLQERVFAPLGMKSVMNIDRERLGDTDPTGYLRFALGPPRVAPKEGKGWLFAAGELAMPAEDLARWDISMLKQSLLKPASYREMATDYRLKSGATTHYGLGISVVTVAGRRAWRHGGEVSGFTADNLVFPDDHAAVIVLTNQDNATAAEEIGSRIAALLFPSQETGVADKLARDRGVFEGLQHGKLDRSLFTENGNSYFTAQAIADFASSLGPLGAPAEFPAGRQSTRGGMTTRVYTIKFTSKILQLVLREMPDGKIEQFQVAAKN